ncbi:MAG: FkbM family methyltransferase [Phenylobacterium sp.]
MVIRKAIDEGRYAEAAAHLRPLSDQGSSDSSNDLAIVYRRMGQPANELFFAHRAFEQNRMSSSALQTLLRALLVQGFFQSAARIYREVRGERCINRSHHVNGAIALIRINRVEEAAEALDRTDGFPSVGAEDLKVELLMARARFEHDRAFALLDRLTALGEDMETQKTSQLFASGDMAGVVAHFDARAPHHAGVRSQGKTALQAAIALADRDRVQRYLSEIEGIAGSTVALARGLLEGRERVEVRGAERTWRFPFVATNFSVALPQVAGVFYEVAALDALRGLIRPGQTVVDVGANIGNHTVYFAGEAGCRVVPFECNPRMVENLKATIALNQLEGQVDLSHLGKAVSSFVGTIPFQFVRDDYSFVTAGEGEGITLTPCLTLDSLDLPECALLKIDVDGGEPGVLEGARDVLARLRPAVSIEVLNFNTRWVLGLFEAYGYDLLREDSRNEAYSDFVFVPRESAFGRN